MMHKKQYTLKVISRTSNEEGRRYEEYAELNMHPQSNA